MLEARVCQCRRSVTFPSLPFKIICSRLRTTAYRMLLKIRRFGFCEKIEVAYQLLWGWIVATVKKTGIESLSGTVVYGLAEVCWVAVLGFHATGQTYPRFSREALDGEGVCLNRIRSKIGVGSGLTVNQRGTSK